MSDIVERLTRERNALKLTVRQLEDFIGRREDDVLVIARERDALKVENERLRAALRRARKHVLSQNRAEGMMDGFGGRRPRQSDDDLAAVDAALNHEGERG